MTTATIPGDVRRIYREARRLGYGAAEALRGARALARFEDEEAEDRVRFRYDPDEDPSGALDFLDAPEWSEEGGREAAAAGRKVRALAERDGVWCALVEIRRPPCRRCGAFARWDVVDSLGGLIGDPFAEEGLPFGYRGPMAEEALAALDAAEEGAED